ncbi:MAG TPA: flagellar hook-basal body complex protein [Tepidisphaeraceae bacterium]|nr:flagellar hook-basal body complex protein [Tepidisphaeraceae bacterium]
MGLTGALYTGVSGLDVNQTWLNTIGNNIANANTTAFKSSRVLFAPQFYVTDSDGTAPTTDFGGTNPSQEGLGASVDTVQKDFSAGQIQNTGIPTDMAINGDGFFVVKGKQQLYTRDGAFTLNSSNQLVTTGGNFVQGYGVDPNSNIQSGFLQNITIPLGATQVAKATGNAKMQGNLDASGAVASGSSILLSQDLTTVGGGAKPVAGTALTSVASSASPATPAFAVGETISLTGAKGGRSLPTGTFTVTGTSTVQDLMTFFQQNMGIDTTVPATTPPPGVTLENGATGNDAHFVITGNTGSQNALQIAGSGLTTSAGGSPLTFNDGTDAAGFTSNPTGESIHTSFQVYDSLGTPVNVDVTAVLQGKSSAGNTWQFYADSPDNTVGGLTVGNGTLTFDTNGNLLSSTGTNITIDRSGTGANTPLSVNLDFSRMTELSGQQSTMVMATQDGFPAGTLATFSVGSDGTITGAYTNGQTRTLGQVAVATFNNPQGLTDSGSNLFAASAGSGAPQVAAPGQLGSGFLQGGALEQSNVDISKEFTNMIVASTGFSASSRVITTSSQLIQELLNSGR